MDATSLHHEFCTASRRGPSGEDRGGVPDLADRLPAVLRAVRHAADLSQRDLAAAAGVSVRTVGAIESGEVASPSIGVVARLLAAAGYRLQVVDASGRQVEPLPWEHLTDRGGRHWPAHLDVYEVRSWQQVRLQERYMGRKPTHSFKLDRRWRDMARANSPYAWWLPGAYPEGSSTGFPTATRRGPVRPRAEPGR